MWKFINYSRMFYNPLLLTVYYARFLQQLFLRTFIIFSVENSYKKKQENTQNSCSLVTVILAITILTNNTPRCIFKFLKKAIGITSLVEVLNVGSSRLLVILGLLCYLHLVYDL